MKQILLIHGGNAFQTESEYKNWLKTRSIRIEKQIKWTDEYLTKNLPDFQIIKPQMPLRENARYEDWKIHFEKHFEYLKDNSVLIGNSLGGIFLAKYLSENNLTFKPDSIILIAPPFDDDGKNLGGNFVLNSNISKLETHTKNLHFFFSSTDEIVKINQYEKYKEKLPNANFTILTNKTGHFFDETFPELINLIKNHYN